jgi:hypothetical protein
MGDEPSVVVRQRPRRTPRPSELRYWEVAYGSDDAGWRVIGWLDEQHFHGAKNVFYFATGVHPVNAGIAL